MKKKLTLIAMVTFWIVFVSRSDATTVAENSNSIVEVTPDSILLLDSGSGGKLFVMGHVPNLCYSYPEITTTQGEQEINIEIKSTVRISHSSPCLQATMPFTNEIDMHGIPKGVYKILINGKSGNELLPGMIPDDIKYKELLIANRDNKSITASTILAFFDRARIEGDRTLVIEGYSPSFCYSEQSVYAFKGEEQNELVVLPMLFKGSDFCPMKLTPVTYKVLLPKSFSENHQGTKTFMISIGAYNNYLHQFVIVH
ncbi:MAG: hypothetical protein HQK50_06750 [Oligoflexia bacterium]|nr:hypothetical protein [Oligoflexia bacterium]MBF0365252.1 hypothetical protein [Oligoflexia bacterium]